MHTHGHTSILLLVGVLTMLIPETTLFSQVSISSPSHMYSHAIIVDPVLAPLGTVHAEYEIALGQSSVTAGLGTWWEYSDIRDTWYHLKVTYYPSATMFDGLAIGLSAGIHHSYSGDAAKRGHDSSPVAGGFVQYNWLLGSADRFLLGAGFGAEMPLKARSSDSPLRAWNGNLRLMAGVLL